MLLDTFRAKPIVGVMNEEESILTELRKISAWADTQRRISKWSLRAGAVIIPVLLLFGFLLDRSVKRHIGSSSTEQNADWWDVDRNIIRGDFDRAINTGEKLIAATPYYPEAHRRLAGAYLAKGNIELARVHYAEAYRLFPSEENEKALNAINKRKQTDQPGQ